ncbi:MAG: hypothetical protein M1817_000519 [Caeruleum heppii]|nr:MAG: hypothetical protein M1817_000519 [Caeruleum heppii]
MVSLESLVTVVSSLVLRVSAYVFLRWIPGHHFPTIIYTAFAVYLPAFIASYLDSTPYNVLADEIDITLTEHSKDTDDSQTSSLPSTAAQSNPHNLRSADRATRQGGDDGDDEGDVDVNFEETLLLEEKPTHPIWTLLSGLPSPTSTFWSLMTALINVLFVLSVLDLIYRGPLLYRSHDLSFARVGYVSPSSAKLLIREPDSSREPIYLSYRNVESPTDDAWKSAGQVGSLDNATDFTTSFTIGRLAPDTQYQYATSTNHSGHFTTAPLPGHAPIHNQGTFTFLASSCIKPHFPYNPFSHPLTVPGLQKLAGWLPQLGASFMLFVGDFIYIDVPHRFGSTVEHYRREYRQVYSSPDWAAVTDNNLPWIHVLDDHEIANDWDSNTTGVYDAAIEPWNHYHHSVNPPAARRGMTYYSFVHGPASFFMLDTRRYRTPSPKSSILPYNSTDKTMLGSEQLSALLNWLRTPAPAGVRWKVLASSVPFTKNWRFNDQDTWGGYLVERQTILEAMWDVGRRGDGVGVVIVSGDRHEFAATGFPPPVGGKWPVSATVHEFSTSPLSQFWVPIRSYKQEDDEDVLIKYHPAGQSKFGALSITTPKTGDQSLLTYRLFVDGEEEWSFVVMTPPKVEGSGRGKDALWG